MRLRHILLGAVALAVQAPAAGSIIYKSYDFHASGFGGPTVTHSGRFGFGYDELTGESVLTLIDFAIGNTPFSIFNASIAPHAFNPGRPQFILGGVRPYRPENSIEHGTDDFWLIFRADPDSGLHFAYSEEGADFYSTHHVDLEAAVISEPPTLPLLALGAGLLIALLMFAARGRRKAVS